MTHLLRMRCIILVCATIAFVTLNAATVAAAPISAGNDVTVKSGDRYWVTAGGATKWCTIAAVGYWRGQRVALTAGHCGDIGVVATNDSGERIGRFVATAKPDSTLEPDHAFIALNHNAVAIQTLSGISAPKRWQTACKYGWGFMNQGTRCGLVYGGDTNYAWSRIAMFFGDSGGPVTQDGKLIGVTSSLIRGPGAFMVFGRADKISGFSL